MFRILQESYIVDSDIYFAYFEGISASYAKRLKSAQKSKQIVESDPDIQAWCLIAISNFLGMRYSRTKMGKSRLQAIGKTAADFITFGLAPEGRSRGDAPRRPQLRLGREKLK